MMSRFDFVWHHMSWQFVDLDKKFNGNFKDNLLDLDIWPMTLTIKIIQDISIFLKWISRNTQPGSQTGLFN